MADEVKLGEDGKPIEEAGTGKKTEEVKAPAGVSKEELEAKITEINKTWQSRFDKILSEKKEKENQAMTVEQRLEQVEKERQAERLEMARERARTKAGIDSELDAAISLYRSSKPEEIESGAASIKAVFDKLKTAHEADIQKAVEEALAKVGAQPKPKGGKDQKSTTLAEFNKLPPKERAEYMAAGGVITD